MTTPLAAETLALFKTQLMNQRDRLLKDLEQTDDALDQTGTSQRGGVDRGDESVAEVETHIRLSQARQDSLQLAAIETALSHIDLGKFGLCSDCQSSIELERLKVDPSVIRCIKCQTKIENTQEERDITPSL